MTRFAVQCTINPSGLAAAHLIDPIAGAVNAAADIAAVTADITAALLVPAISGDAPATTAVTLIQTDFATVTDDLGSPASSDVMLSFNAATVVSKNQLRACVNAILRVIDGSNDLT